MKLYVKNMVCDRCKTIIKEILQNHKLYYVSVELGEIDLIKDILPIQQNQLSYEFQKFGFELVNYEDALLLEKMKTFINSWLSDKQPSTNSGFSDYLSNSIHQNYQLLSQLFAEIESISLDRYFSMTKIEYIKQLLLHDQLNLLQIAHELNYPNMISLSDQFQDYTGLTPLQYKLRIFYQFRLS